jgi:hypothetical protein
LLRLELFDINSLQHFAKEGKVLIGSKKEAEWKIEAHFIIAQGTAAGILSYI